MPDESSLREQARENIRRGRLPSRKPDRVFGGKGSGGTCAVCGRQSTQDELEFEIEFNRHGPSRASTVTIYISGASPRGSSSAPRSSGLRSSSRSCRSVRPSAPHAACCVARYGVRSHAMPSRSLHPRGFR